MNDDLLKLFESALGEISTPEGEEVKAIRDGKDGTKIPQELIDQSEAQSDQRNFATELRDMSVPQKIKLALLGNQIARSLLIRDTNKQIPMFVLQNPRLSENEVYEFARNTNLSEQVLRAIGTNQQWMKSYQTRLAIVSNPKSPIDITLKWVKYLQEKDVKRLSSSKNIPQVISSACRKILERSVQDKKKE